jgi:serine/threonine protein kinase
MIHRDIKPANLMLNTQGQAILMDFGIAKIVGGQSHTATGAVVGTAMYMSPEQIRGESPDRRSDIYSLGVALFEMASGRPPFQADSAMTLMMMHVNDPVPDLKELNPDVPNGLVAVINKALAKDPKDRYQTAGEMASALRSIIGGTEMATSVDVPAPAATMLEEIPPTPEPDATALEQPPAVPQGTVVESAPIPTSGDKTDVGGTVIESPAVKPKPVPQASSGAPPDKRSGLPLPVILGGLGGLAILVIAGIFLFSRGGGKNTPTEEPPVAIVDTVAPTATSAPENTEVVPPTVIPTETAIPPTPTPDTPYVVITEIRIENNAYVVDFEMHNSPSDLHVHMFFDTVPPEQAGSPGAGPWKLIGGAYGPSPFTGYGPANRPPNATQMCSLIANPNHSVQPDSGNCVDLP